MKRLLLLTAAALSMAMAKADSYSQLTFQSVDGSTLSVGVDALTMTFSDGKLLVSNATESHELTVTDLASMYFSDPAGVTDIATDAIGGPVQAYSIDGINLGTYADVDEFTSQAAKGLYIVTGNGKTIKIAVK